MLDDELVVRHLLLEETISFRWAWSTVDWFVSSSVWFVLLGMPSDSFSVVATVANNASASILSLSVSADSIFFASLKLLGEHTTKRRALHHGPIVKDLVHARQVINVGFW